MPAMPETDVQLPPEGIPVMRHTPPPPLPVPALPRAPQPSGRAPGRRKVAITAEHSKMLVVRFLYAPGTTNRYLRAAAYQLAADIERLSMDETWHIEPDWYGYDATHPQVGVRLSCMDGPSLQADMDRARDLLSGVLRGEIR